MKPGSVLRWKPRMRPRHRRECLFIVLEKKKRWTFPDAWLLYDVEDGEFFTAPWPWIKEKLEEVYEA